ncbi:unnamed protein product [Psylliodes chrysocephalus]|uniref:Uncharacterized protein n=1 Tax=Psylliodes chrysocephalus TaxID=3402493 RepID=A0A9P0CY78_9CUCU|nr:unnamed protein product [Psylliodes chrysocephala]
MKEKRERNKAKHPIRAPCKATDILNEREEKSDKHFSPPPSGNSFNAPQTPSQIESEIEEVVFTESTLEITQKNTSSERTKESEEKSEDLHGFLEIFKQTHVSMDNLIDDGLRLALGLYGAPKDVRTSDKPAIELVQSYQGKMYAEATNSKKVDLERIIPTANLLTEHIKRVYFQVQAWYGLQGQDETLDPLERGWELVDG